MTESFHCYWNQTARTGFPSFDCGLILCGFGFENPKIPGKQAGKSPGSIIIVGALAISIISITSIYMSIIMMSTNFSMRIVIMVTNIIIRVTNIDINMSIIMMSTNISLMVTKMVVASISIIIFVAAGIMVGAKVIGEATPLWR